MPKRSRRALCGVKTAKGGKCGNYRDTCPHPSHRRATASASQVKPSAPLLLPRASLSGLDALSDDPSLLAEMCTDAAERYDLTPALIEADYWLIRTLFAWMQALDGISLPMPYRPAERPASAGHVAFFGGTSLSAAWNVSDRWSEDIDLILDPATGLTDKQMRAACKSHARRTCDDTGSKFHELDTGPRYFFFESVRSDTNQRSRVDVIARPLVGHAPVWVEPRPVFSLLGRIAEQDVLHRYPELGGFTVPAVGPGLTMTDKLLAQTEVALSGDLDLIRGRSRDVYDLACIAKQRARFEGHIGRDTRYLLYVSETQRPPDDPRRPPDGFASLRTFDPATPEYEALAEGYESVLTEMVWGEKIPLDEAIRLAVSLDEGPADHQGR